VAFNEHDFTHAKTVSVKHPKMKKHLLIALAVVAVLVLAVLGVVVYARYLRIFEVGAQYTEIYWKNMFVSIAAKTISFLIVFVCFVANNLVIRRFVKKEHDDLTLVSKIVPMLLVTAVTAFIASRFIGESVYSRFLEFSNATMFGIADPLFGQDIGYYIFQRPFLMAVVDSAKVILIIQTVYTIAVYCALQLRLGDGKFRDIFKNRAQMVHCCVNIFLVFLCVACAFKFNSENLLFNTFGNGLRGAGYTDTNVWLTYYKAAPFVLILSILFTAAMLWRKSFKGTICGILVFPVTWLLAGAIALGVQTFVVAPNDVAIESDNISNNILMTRSAYGLDKIREMTMPINNTLTAADLEANAETIDNIRILDYNSTVTAFNKLQGIKPYYTFNNTDITSYTVNGKKTAIALGAREIDYEKLATDASDSYVNRTYKYTHGYGVAASPMHVATPEGQPSFVVKDIPLEHMGGFPEIKQPRIYYGERTNGHVIVNTKLKEIDYSEGQSNVEFAYDGEGGIPLSGFNRILYAVAEGDYKLLVSGQVTADSKILTNRNIIERVSSVAPFFRYDTNPYMVVTQDGRLKWILDGYTVSDQFPYAQKYTDFNYIRNSIKVVVDAYDGTVVFYISDETDPIAQTYKKIYPSLFADGPIPEDIRQHIRYSEYLFKIQAEMYKKYHITDAHVFYNGSDIWDIAMEKSGASETQYISPYYNMMSLEGLRENGNSLYLTMPFTILNKDYISSYFVAGSDGDSYGELVSYRFDNAEKNAYGTMQMENRIDNDPEISGQMTLWGQGGSGVVRGNMLIVPVKDSLLYVEPVYITTNNAASFPELKRVIVCYKENIVMAETLQACLQKLFGAGGIVESMPPETEESGEESTLVPEQTVTTVDADAVLNRLIALYEQYKTYNAEGDYENAGRIMAQIDALLTEVSGTEQ